MCWNQVHIHQSMWSTFEQMIPEGERWNTRSAFNIKHSTSSLSIKQTRARSSKNKTNLHTERHNNRRKSNATSTSKTNLLCSHDLASPHPMVCRVYTAQTGLSHAYLWRKYMLLTRCYKHMSKIMNGH
jgi:serine/threonine protein phosphatase PrpC